MTFLSITTWWGALEPAAQIYWAIAIVASGIFLFQLVIAFIGLDADLDAEIDDGGGFGLISLRTIIAFATFFGWGGVVAISRGYSSPQVLMIAFLFGFLAMVAVAFLFYQLLKMQESGTIDTYKAIARVAEVYIPIPEGKSGTGKIQIEIAEKIMEFDAISEGEALPTGSKVKVMDVVNENVMLVKAI